MRDFEDFLRCVECFLIFMDFEDSAHINSSKVSLLKRFTKAQKTLPKNLFRWERVFEASKVHVFTN